jgi:signal transduction histidine kinase/CheY-like chemotaxis protein
MRYVVALAVVTIALVVALAAWPVLHTDNFVVFLAGVFIASQYGGLGPALFALGVTTVGIYFFLRPYHSPAVSEPHEGARLAIFVAVALVLVLLNEARKRAEGRAACQRDVSLQRRQSARAEAEAAHRKLERLQRIIDVALAHVSVDELLRDLLVRLQQTLEADTVAIFLLDEATGRLTLGAAAGLEHEARRDPTPMGHGFVGRIAAERRPLVGNLEEFAKGFLYERSIRSVVGAPLIVGARLRGVVRAGSRRLDAFSVEDMELLRLAAGRVALAIDNARLYDAERRARDEAEAANRAKDLFLAVLSHELRTPLTPILGWARTLRRPDVTDETRARGMAAIERNARAQAQLIDDLLDVSRIVSGKLQLDGQAVNLVPVIEAAVEAVRPQADARSIKLDAALPTTSELVWGDPNRLQQVFWNLLSNAVMVTPPGGAVAARLETREGRVAVTVTDTGKGIAPAMLPHVFDAFRQADGTTTSRHGGLGLGLTIVRHLVELHGGTVVAESPGEGLGSTFTVTLPLMPADVFERPALDRSTAAEPVTPRVSLRGVRVLVAEDEVDAREPVATMLELHDADVRAVATAEDALAVVDTGWPSILVSDIRMPDKDGYELVEEVRRRDRGRRLPAIALTAYASRQDIDRARAAGFDRHVAKPSSPDVLVRAIAELTGVA